MCNVVKRTSLFVVVFALLLPCVISYAGTVELPRTGQETCFDEDGMVIDCTGTGHDGGIQAGVEWADPRFTDNGDGTIKDNLTGLIWLKDANCFGDPIWQESLDTIADFNSDPGSFGCADYTANKTDWRLPNRKELLSLIDRSQFSPALPQGHPFSNVQPDWYWSSTTFAPSTGRAWFVLMSQAVVSSSNKSDSITAHVWPVRAGQVEPFDDSDIPTPEPSPTATPQPDKQFTFNCKHSMKKGFFFVLETLTMNVGDTENCTLKLTNHEPGEKVEISSQLRKGFRSAIKIEPAKSITDANGELKITITAINKGTDWAAWAVPDDRGQFIFNKKAYDTGLAWGMFVEVR